MRCWPRIWLPVMRRTGWVMRAFAISMERYITAYGTDLLIHSLQACADFQLVKHIAVTYTVHLTGHEYWHPLVISPA